jgi:hypothetical protein
VDAGWPHQVALLSPQVAQPFPEIMTACNELSAPVRFHWFRHDDVDYVVNCFSDKRHAELFALRFGGKYMTPETRPR